MESHEEDRNQVEKIAAKLGLKISASWKGCDALWPLLEKMRGEGAVVVLKLDGQRTGTDDNGPYTAVVSGGALKSDAVRTDARSIEDALAYVIIRYASRAWSTPA